MSSSPVKSSLIFRSSQFNFPRPSRVFEEEETVAEDDSEDPRQLSSRLFKPLGGLFHAPAERHLIVGKGRDVVSTKPFSESTHHLFFPGMREECNIPSGHSAHPVHLAAKPLADTASPQEWKPFHWWILDYDTRMEDFRHKSG
ncbi:hypothetical protein TNCV_534861 [Trichonephila clavipes]|nr:hypothetical protein TNCV_534861 [Trichonephila clavipes]